MVSGLRSRFQALASANSPDTVGTRQIGQLSEDDVDRDPGQEPDHDRVRHESGVSTPTSRSQRRSSNRLR